MDNLFDFAAGLARAQAEMLLDGEKMTIEPENMTVKLLGIGEKNTEFPCEYCGAWTNGITSYKGYICCVECKTKTENEQPIYLKRGIRIGK